MEQFEGIVWNQPEPMGMRKWGTLRVTDHEDKCLKCVLGHPTVEQRCWHPRIVPTVLFSVLPKLLSRLLLLTVKVWCGIYPDSVGAALGSFSIMEDFEYTQKQSSMCVSEAPVDSHTCFCRSGF